MCFFTTELIKYKSKLGDLPPKVAFQLFGKIVKPVALYGAEIWGTKVYECLEDVHIGFCKCLDCQNMHQT